MYKAAFKVLKDLNNELNPEEIAIDYEIAACSAFQKV